MPRDERRRQRSLARKAARHKDKKRAQVHQVAQAGPGVRAALRASTRWPLDECLVSKSWNQPGELVQILVARSEGGLIAVAGILVDLGCLGVKDSLTHVFDSIREYEQFRRAYTSTQPMKRADLDLVAKIVHEGIAYAARFGFKPHPDYRDASLLLAGAEPEKCETPVPLGVEGKPFYIPGPHDDVSWVLSTLERAVGPGNYHYVLEVESPSLTLEEAGEDMEHETRSRSFLLGRRR